MKNQTYPSLTPTAVASCEPWSSFNATGFDRDTIAPIEDALRQRGLSCFWMGSAGLLTVVPADSSYFGCTPDGYGPCMLVGSEWIDGNTYPKGIYVRLPTPARDGSRKRWDLGPFYTVDEALSEGRKAVAATEWGKGINAEHRAMDAERERRARDFPLAFKALDNASRRALALSPGEIAEDMVETLRIALDGWEGSLDVGESQLMSERITDMEVALDELRHLTSRIIGAQDVLATLRKAQGEDEKPEAPKPSLRIVN